MNEKTKIVITSGFRWNYFQWFLLGFLEMEKQGQIELKFKLPFASKILSQSKEKYIVKVADKLRRMFERDSYNMSGYIDYVDDSNMHMRKWFTIDSADAPYLFDSEKLEKFDVYFKMQCPKVLDKDGFQLTDNIRIPWLDHVHVDVGLKKLTDRGERRICRNFNKNAYKIKPLMIGPRALSEKSFSFTALKDGYNNYLKDRRNDKSKEIMCYFGNSNGPKKEMNVASPDYDWEADILGFYGDKISHPNEKRAIVAECLANKEGCDGRVITKGNSDTGIQEHHDLIIPLSDFCSFVSEFKWNVNVSGYRMSIPNRFIESFMVGTGIITDKLSVKWYRPFDEEVFETVKMGYLPLEKVDWKTFENDLNNLPEIKSGEVIKSFEEKWSPEVVARYIIDTVKGVNNT